jgi:hypothetical protein
MSNENDEKIIGTLTTRQDEYFFSDIDAYPNKEGNICVKFDDQSHFVLTPLMATRLNKSLGDAIRSSIGMVLSEDIE